MTLAERLKEQRKRAGLSQEELAELAGVSRQAVTKWESGRAAPSTKHLFRLAEIFGTTVDLLLPGEPPAPETPGAPPCGQEREAPGPAFRERAKRNLRCALAVAAGYLLVYLAGRVAGTAGEASSALGWLFGSSPRQLSYLYGWLLHRNLFWVCMAVSAALALLGRRCAAWSTLLGFAAGLLAGEFFGENPAGAALGQGHYGWAIWAGVFLFSAGMGAALERLAKRGLGLRSRRLWIWAAVFAAGTALAVLLVRAAAGF